MPFNNQLIYNVRGKYAANAVSWKPCVHNIQYLLVALGLVQEDIQINLSASLVWGYLIIRVTFQTLSFTQLKTPKKVFASQYHCIAIKKVTQIIAYYASGTPTLAQMFVLDSLLSCYCAADSNKVK